MRGQVASRLSCFAILSAIETDLREAVRDCADAAHIADLLPPDVRENALARWERDTRSAQATSADLTPGSDLDLLPYSDFADLAKVLRRLNTACWPLASEKTNQIATRLESLASARNRVCHSRPLEPEDFPSLLDFAEWLPRACGALAWDETNATLARLQRDPRFVLGLRIPDFWSVGVRSITNNLPLPDFDETGFLGRTKDRRDLTKLILSPHPVVSVVGAGGVGKTALLLRCLYDLVEAPEMEWDAIVWVSLKTRVLTASGVKDIESAVTSTIGVLQSAAGALGAPTPDGTSLEDCLEEVRQYLEQFRIILALDNFETLSKESLRGLLAAVPRSSKVLLTSRIGLGELELRYPLQALEQGTAQALLRRFAQVLNQRLLVEAPDHQLRKYVDLLFANPLLIKWFVSGVAAGTEPRRLLDRKSEAFAEVMRFCIENLFARLTPTDLRLLHTMASARQPLSMGELLFLLGNSPRDEVEWCLNGLQQASIVERTQRSKLDVATIDYSLSDMAAEFIARHQAPERETFADVQRRLRELRAMEQEGRVQREVYRYDIFSIRAATRDERIAAAYLRRALEANRCENFGEARQRAEEARVLLPLYSEVYRVSGMIEGRAGDPFKAVGEHETALELDPKSTIALYTFAQFLLNEPLNDHERALGLLERAVQLDGPEPALQTARALALVRLGRFQDAAQLYEQLLPGLPAREWKKWRVSTVDQAAECYRRWAEQAVRMADLEQAKQHLIRALAILDLAFDRNDADQHLVKRLGKVLDEAMYIAAQGRERHITEVVAGELERHWRRLRYHEFWNLERFGEIAERHHGVRLPSGAMQGPAERRDPTLQANMAGDGIRHSGRITSLVAGTEYGFLFDDDGQRWFFHRQHFREPRAWVDAVVGSRVEFAVGRNSRGACAVDVTLASSLQAS